MTKCPSQYSLNWKHVIVEMRSLHGLQEHWKLLSMDTVCLQKSVFIYSLHIVPFFAIGVGAHHLLSFKKFKYIKIKLKSYYTRCMCRWDLNWGQKNILVPWTSSINLFRQEEKLVCTNYDEIWWHFLSRAAMSGGTLICFVSYSRLHIWICLRSILSSNRETCFECDNCCWASPEVSSVETRRSRTVNNSGVWWGVLAESVKHWGVCFLNASVFYTG